MTNQTSRQQQFIAKVLEQSQNPQPLQKVKLVGEGQAPVNIALSKYWGKRDKALNLPINGSVSISLPGLGTHTRITTSATNQDQVHLNGSLLAPNDPFAKRLCEFLNWFRASPTQFFAIDTHNSVPTAAGLASSASGYAALVLALDDLFGWQLNKQQLSLLARFGSGSASRSLFNGFALWHKGEQDDGLDSFAEAIAVEWPKLSIGLVKIDIQQKPIGSSVGMQQTVDRCDLYQSWPQQAQRDLATITQAIYAKDFSTLGQTAEHNALSMHATMIATWPPIVYWQPESISAMQQVWQLRQEGVEVYFTMDAGPNLKLILETNNQHKVEQRFADLGMNIEFIQPFQENHA